jgi:hypothetical protein
MIEIVNIIFEIIKEILPDRKDKLFNWFIKLVTSVAIILLLAVTTFLGIRDTPVGVGWGINTPPQLPQLSNREYRDIYETIYIYLLRLKEQVPEIRAVFFIVAFDKNGNINYADRNYDRIGIFTWYRQNPAYISFETFEEVMLREKKNILKKVAYDKLCMITSIDAIGQERYRQASPMFMSNRSVLCPVPSQGKRLPFGAIAAYWIDDPKQPHLDDDIKASARDTSDLVGQYLLSRKDLELNK